MTQSTPDLHNNLNYEQPSSHGSAEGGSAASSRSKVRFRTPVVEAPATRKSPPNSQVLHSVTYGVVIVTLPLISHVNIGNVFMLKFNGII